MRFDAGVSLRSQWSCPERGDPREIFTELTANHSGADPFGFGKQPWMGGRVVEGTSLENWRTFARTVGSNPTPSAEDFC